MSWDTEDWDHARNEETGEDEPYYPKRITTFPAPPNQTDKPDWAWDLLGIDEQLGEIMSEVYVASNNGLLILASVGLRTAFDRTTEILNVDPGHSLMAKVEELLKAGHIGQEEAKALRTVVDAGSAAAHRGWEPLEGEFKALLSALEQFMHRTLILGETALAVRAGIPAKHPKPKKDTKIVKSLDRIRAADGKGTED